MRELSLGNLRVLPGLVNAHDHLEFSLFPRLGRGPYANAQDWARDIYHPEKSPIREHLLVPKPLRFLWGGLRNLLSGVTVVCHHNPYHASFENDFPVRVVKNYDWAHSLAFDTEQPRPLDVAHASACIAASAAQAPEKAEALVYDKSYATTSPFLIHLGEGTDAQAANEIFRLHELGRLHRGTVLIHALGLNESGWQMVAEAGAAVVWCPQSNLFTLGRTFNPGTIPRNVPVALGTDSPLTSCGDLLDELRVAATIAKCAVDELLPMVTRVARSILHLPAETEDWFAAPSFGEPPEAVVSEGRLVLISPALAIQLPLAVRDQFYSLELRGRPKVLVRWNIPELLDATRPHLDGLPLTLGGREVLA